MVPNIRAGKVKGLATTGTRRSALLPDLLTVAEAGVPGYESVIWLGLMAPAGTPRPILERLNAEINKVLNRPDLKDTWIKQGADPTPMTPDQFAQFLREDIEKQAKNVKLIGGKID